MLLTLFVSRTILLAEKASSLDPQVHIMAETTRKMVDDPHAYEMHLPVRARRNRLAALRVFIRKTVCERLIKICFIDHSY